MLDLVLSGLPLQWDPQRQRLIFGAGMEQVEPAVRTIGEMQDVLYRGEELPAAADEAPEELYFMYRDVHLLQHRSLLRQRGIRYDLTVLVPGTVGKEYIKTAGHYHPCKPGTKVTYPEVYEVLHGSAHYLFQRLRNDADPCAGVDKVIVVAAGPGDKVLIPSSFGHITINPGPDYLIMSNLVADNFASIYKPLSIMHGAAYYELAVAGQGHDPLFVPNPNYPSLPSLCFTRPKEVPHFFLVKDTPQYRAFLEHEQSFSFLTAPENFQEEFKNYLQALTNFE